MNQYRITKYNPKLRNMNGYYTVDEWTDFADVGKVFNGVELTLDKYLECENAYIKTVLSILNLCNVKELVVKEFEIYNNSHSLNENQIVIGEDVCNIVQNILRNNFWCKLETKNFFIHFGFDYYMYIGCNLGKQKVIEIANDNYLYCEEILSPYYES